MTSSLPLAVLWDLDGTLVDSRRDLAAAGNVARAAIGLPPLSDEIISGYVGDGMSALLARLTPDRTSAEREQASQAFVAHYGAHCADATRPFDGIEALLDRLQRAGVKQAVVTNKPLAFAETVLGACHLAGFFAAVVGGDAARKPAPEQLFSALVQLAVAPGPAVWMLGDHHTDLQAGRAAGCRTCHCRWGIGHAGETKPDAVAETPAELAALLLPG